MDTITLEELVEIQESTIKRFGGSVGIRDRELVESALNRGLATFDGVDLYNPIERKISVITYSLISNHGFVDGNKRIGVSIMILLCKLNNINLKFAQEELIEFGLEVAKGNYKEDFIFKWILEHKVN